MITPHAKVRERISLLQEATGEAAHSAGTLSEGLVRLRAQEYAVVVLDQMFLESEPDESDATLQHMGTALPVYINFGISRMDRVVKEVRLALARRRREEVAAREAARQALRTELAGMLTSVLLSCELALGTPGLPEPVVRKMHTVHGLAQQMSALLNPEA